MDQCDAVDVFGVVKPGGVCGSRNAGAWILLFSLAVWRIGGDLIQRQELTVRKRTTDAEFERIQKGMAAYDVIHLRARVAFDNILGKPQALLLEVLGHCDTDLELLTAAKELQKPVTFHDSEFGTFVLNRRINWYEANTSLEGLDVRLSLSPGESGKLEELLATSRILFRAQDPWCHRATDYAVSELLTLKNEAWLGEDESELSAAQFRARIKLTSIVIRSGERFEFWYEDGDLFWGHSISVSGDLINGPKDANIQG